MKRREFLKIVGAALVVPSALVAVPAKVRQSQDVLYLHCSEMQMMHCKKQVTIRAGDALYWEFEDGRLVVTQWSK